MRSTNLGTLANMFNASGFVNYVSSIYLQNLADVANVRFHRMTKNQLSLTINSSNEFEIIDYLNNGASRSVKPEVRVFKPLYVWLWLWQKAFNP
jgi:exonuclease SbcC